MTDAHTHFTIHGVLAGAYKAGRERKAGLTHASKDGGDTAICGKVKVYALCDLQEPGPPTCKACNAKLTRLQREARRL